MKFDIDMSNRQNLFIVRRLLLKALFNTVLFWCARASYDSGPTHCLLVRLSVFLGAGILSPAIWAQELWAPKFWALEFWAPPNSERRFLSGGILSAYYHHYLIMCVYVWVYKCVFVRKCKGSVKKKWELGCSFVNSLIVFVVLFKQHT